MKHHHHAAAAHLHHAAAGAVGPHGLPAHAASIAIIIVFWAALVLFVQLLKGSGRRSAQRYY